MLRQILLLWICRLLRHCSKSTCIHYTIYYIGLNSSEQEINEILQEVDSDGDGGIDFPTFLAVLDSKLNKPKETEQDILEIFQIFDPKG